MTAFVLVVYVLFQSPLDGARREQRWVAGETLTLEECVARGQYLIGAVSELDGAIGGGFLCERATR